MKISEAVERLLPLVEAIKNYRQGLDTKEDTYNIIEKLEAEFIMVPACSKKGKMQWDPEDDNNTPA